MFSRKNVIAAPAGHAGANRVSRILKRCASYEGISITGPGAIFSAHYAVTLCPRRRHYAARKLAAN
jgi:hypothetical protein